MSANAAQQRKANAKELADGYTWQKRATEIFCITVSSAAWLYCFVHVSRIFVHDKRTTSTEWLYLLPCVLGGMAVADFLSGVAHWALDTWGSTATPIFGLLIRSFREHHVDQTSITRHDFIETNGDNFLAVLPVMVLMTLFPARYDAGFLLSPLFQAYMLILVLFVALTNQTHKVAHQVRQPPFVKPLMDLGIILTPQNHRVHHSGDFSLSYCITTGWLNKPLDAINFWRIAERIITLTTGAVPRADDKKVLVQE